MTEHRIKNFDKIANTENRKIILEIIETGINAIDTQKVIENSLVLEGNILKIQDKEFDLNKFKKIKVVGFGKSSSEGALALEKILGSKINEGAVISIRDFTCKYIRTYTGTHPKPSKVNLDGGNKIFEIINNSTEEDLIIVLVSGGGSALLCHPEEECEQGIKLYDSFLKSGKSISEINTVRKHLSLLKGGGLAKLAYPATVVGLIFSDVPGDNFSDVASGPTYLDKSTIKDAEKIIKDNNLGEFKLLETPKEDKYFEKVSNFVLVSNKTAVEAMAQKAKEFGLEANIISTDLYDETNIALQKIFSLKKENSLVLAAGEPKIKVENKDGKIGKGGRNLHMSLLALKNYIENKDNLNIDEDVFISFASDGMDNSDVAGAIVDKETLEKAKKLNLDVNDYLARFDSYSFFQKTSDLIITGPTGANVSDLMILLNKKNGITFP